MAPCTTIHLAQARRARQLSASADSVLIPDTLRIDPVIHQVSMHDNRTAENRLNRFYPGDSTEPSMESILDLVDIVNGSRPCAGPFTQEASRLQPGG